MTGGCLQSLYRMHTWPSFSDLSEVSLDYCIYHKINGFDMTLKLLEFLTGNKWHRSTGSCVYSFSLCPYWFNETLNHSKKEKSPSFKGLLFLDLIMMLVYRSNSTSYSTFEQYLQLKKKSVFLNQSYFLILPPNSEHENRALRDTECSMV